MASIADFQKLDLRVAQIKEAMPAEGSDKLFVLKVDVGGRDIQLVAGLRGHYTEKQLVGKKIVVIANLDPAKIRGIESQGMLLAAVDGKVVTLLSADKKASVGAKVM
jgi:methionine--tRNA ligase beta chain